MARKSFADRVRERDNKGLDESAQKLRTIRSVDQSNKTTDIIREQAAEQESKQPSNRQNKRATNRATNRIKEQPTEQESKQPIEQLIEQRIEQSTKQQIEQSIGQSTNLIPEKNRKEPVFWLKDNYAEVLKYIINMKTKIASVKDIASSTKIPYGTIRKAITVLVKYDFILKPKPYQKGRVRGSEFSINEQLCQKFINKRCLEQSIEHRIEQYPGRATDRTIDRASPLYSSSSIYKKTTTKEIEFFLTTHPEFGYWRQKKLTSKQIEQWIEAINCSVEDMIQYLCYCRFEMVDLGVEESKPIKNVFNWFFKIIEKTGSYPQPNGYKSHEEKQLEAEHEIVTQREKEAQEAKKLYQRKIEAEQDKKFWDIMNDPESDLYKQCFDSLNSIAKKQPTTGKGFEMSMRVAFDSLTQEISP